MRPRDDHHPPRTGDDDPGRQVQDGPTGYAQTTEAIGDPDADDPSAAMEAAAAAGVVGGALVGGPIGAAVGGVIGAAAGSAAGQAEDAEEAEDDPYDIDAEGIEGRPGT